MLGCRRITVRVIKITTISATRIQQFHFPPSRIGYTVNDSFFQEPASTHVCFPLIVCHLPWYTPICHTADRDRTTVNRESKQDKRVSAELTWPKLKFAFCSLNVKEQRGGLVWDEPGAWIRGWHRQHSSRIGLRMSIVISGQLQYQSPVPTVRELGG